MEKNYRHANLISSKNSKLAREQFRAEKEKIEQNKSFIKKMTDRKIKPEVAKTPESRLIRAKIDFATRRKSSLAEMTEIMQNFIDAKITPVSRADRIIASYLKDKRENAELSVTFF